ncbi:hypothetical protein LCGC14_2897020, partial [marine sediment metagenome]
MTDPRTMEPARPDIDLQATFDNDGRTETVIEITNLDHSATYGYAVPGFEHMLAAAPDLLAALEDVMAWLDNWD